VLRLRALAYREELEGFGAVSNSYREVSEKTNSVELAREAGNLIWFHGADTNALLGINAFCRFRVYLDGVPVGGGDDPTSLFVYPVDMSPGSHELEVEITPTRPDPFLLAYLRTHSTNIITDASWEYMRHKPAGWPSPHAATDEWKLVEHPRHCLPKMVYWQFVPNAYIVMQSTCGGIRPWPESETPSGENMTAYLRKKFVIPQTAPK
jgi:hypothetical protein